MKSLRYLKRHYKLAILSNVDNESFSFSNEKLGVDFDAVYTAEDCGSYKPSARNFEYMFAKLKTLGIEKSEILHTAESLFHDHGPANELGSPHAGFIAATARKALARPWLSPRRPITIFALRAWRPSSKRIKKR